MKETVERTSNIEKWIEQWEKIISKINTLEEQAETFRKHKLELNNAEKQLRTTIMEYLSQALIKPQFLEIDFDSKGEFEITIEVSELDAVDIRRITALSDSYLITPYDDSLNIKIFYSVLNQ